MSGLAGVARAALRIIIYPPLAAICFADYAFSRARGNTRRRVDWLRRTATLHAKWLGFRIRVHGEIPRTGLIVSNHVSYLDILALSTAATTTFVSKKEVAGWPLFGSLAKMGATIFVDRERRGAVSGVAAEMRAHLDAGVPLVLFPEGTSSDGTHLLPFRSSLFEPVVQLACPLTACGLRYSLAGGSVVDEVAYWGDMNLATHMINLLGKTGLTVDIHFGPSRTRESDRKTLARDLHAEVSALAGLA